jgi:hypothetical protein
MATRNSTANSTYKNEREKERKRKKCMIHALFHRRIWEKRREENIP